MKNTSLYLGIALLFTHELDAMSNHEWRLLPGLKALSDAVASATFLIAHVPLFAIVIALIASLNLAVRAKARNIACGFLVVHAVAHFLFSSSAAYEFSSAVSPALIYGAGVCGLTYFLAHRLEQDPRKPG